MSSGDNMSFQVISGAPVSINGNNWALTDGKYTMSLDSNSVVKNLTFVPFGDYFTIQYNSF